MIDRSVETLVDRAIAGTPPSKQEATALLMTDASSPEAAYIRWGAELIGREAAHNTGQIYAQIGVDAGPCPENCAFCALAASSSARKEPADVSVDAIIASASTFDRAGVHLISLMSTAGFDFDRFLSIVKAVREAISPDMPIMANIGDIDANQARTLATAGVQAAYHAHRLGEGIITSIDPARRTATFAALKTAGLKLMSAVEPVHAASDPQEVADRMFEVIACSPYCSGVGTLTVVAGTGMESYVPLSRKHSALLAAVMRLVAGRSIPFGTGCGNVRWTDAGTNPRGRNLIADPDYLLRDVSRLRKELADSEWTVPDRPLASWFDGDAHLTRQG